MTSLMSCAAWTLAGATVMTLVQASGQSPPAQQTPKAAQPAAARPNPDSQYRLGPDSMPHEGVPKGEIRGPFTLPCAVFPGTQHTY